MTDARPFGGRPPSPACHTCNQDTILTYPLTLVQDFLAWLPPQHVADMAEAAARARARPAPCSMRAQSPALAEVEAGAAAAAAGTPEVVGAAAAMSGRAVGPQLPSGAGGSAALLEPEAVAAAATAQGVDRGPAAVPLTIVASFLSHGQAGAINRQLEGGVLGAWVSVAAEMQGVRWDCVGEVPGVDMAAVHE